MQTSKLVMSILCTWIMTFIYIRIESITGVKVDMLLYTAMMTLASGLYLGLKTKDERATEEET